MIEASESDWMVLVKSRESNEECKVYLDKDIDSVKIRREINKSLRLSSDVSMFHYEVN